MIALSASGHYHRFSSPGPEVWLNTPLLRSEKSSSIYNTDVLTKIFKEEGKDLFDARSASLGHTLQGGVPSPLDRTRAARLSLKCMQFLEQHAVPNAQAAKGKRQYSKQTAAMIAIRGRKIVYATMDEVRDVTDMKLRKGKDEWWAHIKPLAEVRRSSPASSRFCMVLIRFDRSWVDDRVWWRVIWSRIAWPPSRLNPNLTGRGASADRLQSTAAGQTEWSISIIPIPTIIPRYLSLICDLINA